VCERRGNVGASSHDPHMNVGASSSHDPHMNVGASSSHDPHMNVDAVVVTTRAYIAPDGS